MAEVTTELSSSTPAPLLAPTTDTEMNPADGPLAPSVLPGLALARYGQPWEVAEAVAFLAGPGAAYVTGSGILVDGGANA